MWTLSILIGELNMIVYDAIKYGAVGDGKTNDAMAIQLFFQMEKLF